MSHGWLRNKHIRDGVIGAEKLDEGIERVATVTLTSAELLALNATPIEVVAAPGAGKAIVVEGIQAHYDYGTAAYVADAGDDLAFKYTNASGDVAAVVECTGFITETNDEYRWVYPSSAVTTARAEVQPVANAALVAHMLNSEVITGDGVVHLRVSYRVVTLDLSS